jgi:TPR repeat protein
MNFKAIAMIVVAMIPVPRLAAGPLEDADAAFKRSDYKTAFRLYHSLADQGDAKAQYRLGDMYSLGAGGTPKDADDADRWFRKAANQGYISALIRQGSLAYISCSYGVACPDAVRWLRAGAEQGNAGCQSLLGRMYERGYGLPQDYVLAHLWLNLAAANGDETYKRDRDSVAKNMTASQIAEAQKLAREWKPNK